MPPQGPRVPADFDRATRWEAGRVLRELGEASGIDLMEDGRPPGGQIGAAYVRWPDGHRSVLTCRPAKDRQEAESGLVAARQSGRLSAAARWRGVPAPAYELVEILPVGIAIVQELMPGSPPATVTRQTVESMLEVNGLCRGLLASWTDLAAPSLYLLTDGPGFCLHAPMASYDRRTARLLGAIEEIGSAVPEVLAGEDLVHFDFHPENVLVDTDGNLTGVIDWDGANRSNGVLDLTTLRFDLARREPGLAELLAGGANDMVSRACWAHMSLRLIDWAIREHGPADVNAWIDVANELMP